jgi:hypothetical protein
LVDLRAQLADLKPSVVASPWPQHEHVRGYGVFGLPLSSGHVLALRVFPVNDFAPYTTVWHRDAAGAWSIHYDAPRPDIACPRYYGQATRNVQAAHIALEWNGPTELTVRMDQPELIWTVQMRETPALSVLNGISRALPFWTWQHEAFLKPREWVARLLGLGTLHLAGVMPSGHFGVLMPQQMYFIARSHVVLDGQDLGVPARVTPNPRIGDVPLPARGVFAIGQAHWTIRDPEEYARTRTELSQAALD